MGKKKRLNRFITKWIKSDLPEDRSTVLLLGVTRIPTTPTAARRPCSLPLPPPLPQNLTFPKNSIIQHKSRKTSFQSRRNHMLQNALELRRNSAICKNHSESKSTITTCSNAQNQKAIKRVAFGSQNSSTNLSSPDFDRDNSNSSASDKLCSTSGSDDATSSNTNMNSSDFTPGTTMDSSVDSIGACSLDAEASVDLTDWSEQSSVGTLRSLSLPTPEPQPHLPSYLSLACTVSGYSTTTNYDPERLAKSRDASPHRFNDDLNSLTPHSRNSPIYSIRNNLLSPPNIVPLPNQKYIHTKQTPKAKPTMDEQIVSRQEFYSSSSNYISKESRNFVSSMLSKDSIDGCVENGHPHGAQSKCINYESRTTSYITNGVGKTLSETSYKEFTNEIQQKSFIQQRVERLYGPGALAQGFFISKSPSTDSNTEKKKNKSYEKYSKSITEQVLQSEINETSMKQSTSSPTLPVLRHLRPEFRAQLPIISPRKGCDGALPKSVTIPTLKEELKVNGHSGNFDKTNVQMNGNKNVILKDDLKDGHFFLQIIDKETERLLKMADSIEKELDEESLTEDVKGKLRSASGKARLLTSQKMQQFKGLCTNNITQKEGDAFPTTNEDLQGFWDMVLLQVEQVDALFKEIDELRKNGWIEKEPVPVLIDGKSRGNGFVGKSKKVVARPVKQINKINEEARKEREIKRKQMIEERRRAMREQKQNVAESIEIFVPE